MDKKIGNINDKVIIRPKSPVQNYQNMNNKVLENKNKYMNLVQNNGQKDQKVNINNGYNRPVSGIAEKYRAVTPDRINVNNRQITPDRNKQVVKIIGGGVDPLKNKPNPNHQLVNAYRPDRPKTPDYDRNKIVIKKK